MGSVTFEATAIFTKGVFEASTNNPRYAPSYTIGVLVQEGTKAYQMIREDLEKTIALEYPQGYSDAMRSKLKLRKAEDALPNDKYDNSRYHGKGYWFLNLSSSQERPFTVATMQGGQPTLLMDKSMIFPGVKVAINLRMTKQEQADSGIGFYCNGILTQGEAGEFGRLDGIPTIDQQFGNFQFSGSTASTPEAPVSAPPPPAAEQMIEGKPISAWYASGWTDESLKAHGKI